MKLRILILPAALLLAAAFVATPEAEAAPFGAGLSAKSSVVMGPRIFVGGDIGIPIGRRGGYWRTVVSYEGGFYTTELRPVTVPGPQIGNDFEGRPIYGPSVTRYERVNVWVPQRRVHRRVWVPAHSHGMLTIGGGWRIR